MDFKPETDLSNMKIGQKDSKIFDAISKALEEKPMVSSDTLSVFGGKDD